MLIKANALSISSLDSQKKVHPILTLKSKRGRNFNGNGGVDGRVLTLVKLKDSDIDL